MPISWDGEADRKLLLSILKTQSVSVDCDAVAKDLSTGDTVCTPRAVQERIKKLKKMIAADSTTTPGGDEEASAVPKAKSTPRKRKSAGNGADESPTKQRKGTKGKAAKDSTTPGAEEEQEEAVAVNGIKAADGAEE